MIDSGKRNVLGVMVDVIDYEAATERVLAAARERRRFALTALAVHGVMTGVGDARHGARLNAFDLVTPDGQPVRWALNLLYKSGLDERVYGPDLTRRILARCADEGLPVYFYGSTPETLARLSDVAINEFPGLVIAGTEPSKFRMASEGEADEIAQRVEDSGARLLLVGLGCPRQETFAFAMRSRLSLPLLAVGAAFDYFAGNLRRPPAWMQRAGLEWLWRLGLEPRRLWRRYVILNPQYVGRLTAQKVRVWSPVAPEASSEDLWAFPI